MDEADGGRYWIDNVNRAAIGHVNAERDAALIGDETVAAGEFFVRRWRKIDNRNFVAVDLFGGKQRPIAHSDFAADLEMRGVETAQGFGFVVRDIDAGNASGENVTAIRQLA